MNPEKVADFEAKGLKFVGHDVDGERMEIMELQGENISTLNMRIINNNLILLEIAQDCFLL